MANKIVAAGKELVDMGGGVWAELVAAVNTDGSAIGTATNTQYTEGDADATITGTALMFEADTASSTMRAVSDTYPLSVRQAALTSANDSVTAVISGTPAVTATGNVAHAATDSGNPLKVGGKARTADPTALTDGQRADWTMTKLGKGVVMPYTLPENIVNGSITTNVTDTTSTALLSARAAGIRIYVTSFSVQNSHATVSTWIKLLDGSTVIWRVYCAAAGGGETITFPVPLMGTAATALNVQAETTGASFGASFAGYTGA